MIPPNTFRSIIMSSLGGFAVTMGSTTVACLGALWVERTAHRALFRCFPHWYRDVDYAFGIEPYELEAVRGFKEGAVYVPRDEATKVEAAGKKIVGRTYSAELNMGSSQIFNCAMTA
jgi:hypothetical protein